MSNGEDKMLIIGQEKTLVEAKKSLERLAQDYKIELEEVRPKYEVVGGDIFRIDSVD